MEDKLFKLRGEFYFEAIRDGKVIDSYEDKNLVVDGARAILASLISGINKPVPINKLSLGTLGYNEQFDKFTPKVVDAEYQVGAQTVKFDSTRSKLFSQDLGSDTLDLSFDSIGNEDIQQTVSLNASYGTSEIETSTSTVEISCTCNSVIYKFEIEQGVGHGGGDGSVTAYTEAGLFADNIMFATKTFSAKVKDNSTKFIITWKIFT